MKKTIEQLAKEYAERCYPYDEEMRFQCEQHFEAGAAAMSPLDITEIPVCLLHTDMMHDLEWIAQSRDDTEMERTASDTITVRRNGKALTLREIFKILGKE